jgi:probable rRNA maturation factor
MARYIDIQVDKPFRSMVSSIRLRKVARKVLEVANAPPHCELALMITQDQNIRRLNRDYRGLDEVTDVLAFSPEHGGHYEGISGPEKADIVAFPTMPGIPKVLGDVIISYSQVERQAQERALPVQQELALLVVHGILHLLGHDHWKDDEAESMKFLEEQVMADVG